MNESHEINDENSGAAESISAIPYQSGQGVIDRFIPMRSTSLFESGFFSSPRRETAFAKLLYRHVIGEETPRLLSYSKTRWGMTDKAPMPTGIELLQARRKYEKSVFLPVPMRHEILDSKVLDAPGLHANYYLNLLTSSKINNTYYISLMPDDGLYQIYGCSPLNKKIYASEPMPFRVEPHALKAFGERSIVSSWNDRHVRIHQQTQNELELLSEIKTPTGIKVIHAFACIDKHNIWGGAENGWLVHIDSRVNGIVSQFRTYSERDQAHLLLGMGYNQRNQIAIGTNNGLAKIWDLRSLNSSVLTPPTYFMDEAHSGADIKCLEFNPNDSSELLTGGASACRHLVLRNIDFGGSPNKYELSDHVTGIHWIEQTNFILAATGFSKSIYLMKKNGPAKLKYINKIQVDRTENACNVYMAGINNEIALACYAPEDQSTLRFFSVSGIPNNFKLKNKRGIGLLEISTEFTIR